MKLTIKLIAIATGVTMAVMSVQVILQTRHLAELSLHEMRDELAILALAFGSAADELWRTAGPEEAEAFVERADRRRGRFVWTLDAGARQGAALSAQAFAALPREERASRIEQRGDELVIGLAVGGGRGLLELHQPLDSHHAYVDSVMWRQVSQAAVLALFYGLALLLVGFRLIGRPLGIMTEHARTVAEGDFSARVQVRQRDEIGGLAREMNRMSERIEQAWDEARHERSARTAALEQLRHADRLSTVGKIASSIAHDLGTPLNVVSGRAMMIMSTPGCPPEISADARIITEQADNMTQIIRQMLDYSRSRALQRESVEVRELLAHAITLVEPLADEQGVSIEHVEPAELVARMDQHKILQVLTNLMINGIQAMPDGGKLELRASTVDIDDPPDSRAAAGTYVRISVQDEGVGIAVKSLERIFEPFFTTKVEGQGTGLGLPVCHGIVREHGGWIDVQSQSGKGSRFDIYLPQSNDEGVKL